MKSKLPSFRVLSIEYQEELRVVAVLSGKKYRPSGLLRLFSIQARLLDVSNFV